MKLTAIFLVLASAAILAAANQPLLGRPQHLAQSYAQRHQRFVLVGPKQHQQLGQPAFVSRTSASTRSSSNVRPVAAPLITRSSASYETLSSPPAAPVFTQSAASFQTLSSPPVAPLVLAAPLTSSGIGFQQEQSQQRQASSSSAASAAFSSQQRSSNLIYVLDDDSGETSAEDGLFFRPPQRLIRAYDANTGQLVNTRAVPNF